MDGGTERETLGAPHKDVVTPADAGQLPVMGLQELLSLREPHRLGPALDTLPQLAPVHEAMIAHALVGNGGPVSLSADFWEALR